MPGRIEVWRKRGEALREQQEAIFASQRTLREAYLRELRSEVRDRAPGRAGFAGWLHRRVLVPGAVVSGRVGLDDLGTHSGALTYASLIAFPPLMLFVLSVASFALHGDQAKLDQLITGISDLFPSDFQSSVNEFLTKQLHTASNARVTIGILGLIGLVWTASSLASRIRHAFGFIFGTERTGLLTGRFAGMIIGVLIVAAIFAIMFLSSVKSWLHDRIGGSVGGTVASEIAVWVASFVFLLVLYWVLTPGKGPPFFRHVPGALLFVIGLAGLEALGGLYFSSVVERSTALYGTIGVLFGIVAFVYSTTWLLLLGAEVSAEYWSQVEGGGDG